VETSGLEVSPFAFSKTCDNDEQDRSLTPPAESGLSHFLYVFSLSKRRADRRIDRKREDGFAKRLVKGDGGLDGALVAHRLEALLPLLQLEGLVDDAAHLDLAAVEVVNGGGELVGLGEGAEYGDFVSDCGKKAQSVCQHQFWESWDPNAGQGDGGKWREYSILVGGVLPYRSCSVAS
jgi:hypothetical protein